MVGRRKLLSWAFAMTLGGTSAAIADEPVSFVVYPEVEVSDSEETSESLVDRLFHHPVVTPVVAEAFFESDCCPEVGSPARASGCSLAEGCSAAVGCSSDAACAAEAWFRFDSEAKSVLPADNPVDNLMKTALAPKDWFDFPINVGGWHWWNIDTGGVGNGGYGAANFRGTYAYYVIGQPSVTLEDGSKIGGFVFFAGRDGDPYRTYYSSNFWFLEGYGSYTSDDLGTIKAGLVNKRFGLDGYLGFIGTAPYFDGFIMNADYGISLEKTHDVSDDLTIDTFAQFFFHDGAWNGGLRNHNTESVSRLHERNTVILRAVPKWKLGKESTLAWGVSAMVGSIDSNIPGFISNTRSVWGTDLDYHCGPLNLRGEVLQINGRTVPNRFASGGPSNRITSFTTEAGYTVGPVKYRGVYSASYDANPDGRQNIWSLGTVTQVTPNVRLFTEYTEWTVDGNAFVGHATIIEGVQMVVHWQY
ncbi:MAG: hypothetical protein HQ518_14985 [Rhodopirellula sp.]|nr:hypothetical protein [Rhodopirellula sp.]